MSGIVVLGGGIGGLSAAFELKDVLGKRHRITLVSDQANFEFTPSNPWVAVKWRKPEAIRIGIRQLFHQPHHVVSQIAEDTGCHGRQFGAVVNARLAQQLSKRA